MRQIANADSICSWNSDIRLSDLSLSPGETPLNQGEHVSAHANMWRISDGFWDGWQHLLPQFTRLRDWTGYRIPGAWPDADMLPLRIVEFNRKTRFTPEQIALADLPVAQHSSKQSPLNKA